LGPQTLCDRATYARLETSLLTGLKLLFLTQNVLSGSVPLSKEAAAGDKAIEREDGALLCIFCWKPHPTGSDERYANELLRLGF
jgi:hypothetical protein